MSNRVHLSPRDRALLQVLGWTPATTALLLQASRGFEGGPFADDRRLRERLSSFAAEGFVRSWGTATVGGGLQNYYKITPAGFAAFHGPDVPLPPRAFFAEIAPSHFAHTMRLAEAVVVVVRACPARRVVIAKFFRENELTLPIGGQQLQPDFFVRLATAGRTYSFAFEIDTGQESLDSSAGNSVRRKLTLYHAYQNQMLTDWQKAGKAWEEPRFRAVFLTTTVARAYHVLALARQLQPHTSRRLVYAAAQDSFTTDADPLMAPLFLDHFGRWQALVDHHPTAKYLKEPVRLAPVMESPFAS